MTESNHDYLVLPETITQEVKALEEELGGRLPEIHEFHYRAARAVGYKEDAVKPAVLELIKGERQ